MQPVDGEYHKENRLICRKGKSTAYALKRQGIMA